MAVEITRLANGIHVITDHYSHLETTALGLWVRAGARDESEADNGLAHLLEHMAFKGTSKRTSRQIAEDIESAGGDINASTSMETTGYYAKVLKDDWRLALDVISDIVTDPIFDAEELACERDVVLQEIAAAHDTPDDLVFDLAQKAAFPNHAIGRSILGPAQCVSQFQVSDLERYRAQNYHGKRMVLAAAGYIDHDALVAEASRLFATIPEGQVQNWDIAQMTSGTCTEERPLDQSHVVFSFPSVSYHDENIYTAQVLTNLLGGGMSSRLFQEVREKRGLCYSVFSYISAYQDTGVLSVYAGTSPERLDELTAVSCQVMHSVAEDVTETEIARAKAQLKAGLVMNLENSSSRAEQIARQFLAYGEVPDLLKMTARIESVTVEGVTKMAEKMFKTNQFSLGAVGKFEQTTDWHKVGALFS